MVIYVVPLSTQQVRALLAVQYIHGRQRRVTVRALADQLGVTVSTAHAHLRALRRKGWVTWTDGEDGTIRPTCMVVAAG